MPTTLVTPVEERPVRQLSQVSSILSYMLAGNATFTVRSKLTGMRYTYRVRVPKYNSQKTQFDKVWFVQVLVGPDNNSSYKYLGMITQSKDVISFKVTTASLVNGMAKGQSGKTFAWLFRMLTVTSVLPEQVEFWHSGTCGRCGKKLTVPESIEMGIGPDCAGKL